MFLSRQADRSGYSAVRRSELGWKEAEGARAEEEAK